MDTPSKQPVFNMLIAPIHSNRTGTIKYYVVRHTGMGTIKYEFCRYIDFSYDFPEYKPVATYKTHKGIISDPTKNKLGVIKYTKNKYTLTNAKGEIIGTYNINKYSKKTKLRSLTITFDTSHPTDKNKTLTDMITKDMIWKEYSKCFTFNIDKLYDYYVIQSSKNFQLIDKDKIPHITCGKINIDTDIFCIQSSNLLSPLQVFGTFLVYADRMH